LFEHRVRRLFAIGQVLVVARFDPVFESWHVEDLARVGLIALIFITRYTQEISLERV